VVQVHLGPLKDPDRNAVTYWVDPPGAPDPESRGIRALRSMASQSSLSYLTSTYAGTTAAVRVLARRTSLEATVTTQKHVLRVDDLLATLAVEAAIHHLDMIVELDYPGPADAALAVVRSTLDGLLGKATPADWSDTDWALRDRTHRTKGEPPRGPGPRHRPATTASVIVVLHEVRLGHLRRLTDVSHS
jgi:hypothetical protein